MGAPRGAARAVYSKVNYRKCTSRGPTRVWPPSFYNCYSMARHNGKIYEGSLHPY